MLSKYAVVLQKIYWLLYLQLLWVLFSLLGLGIFGVFPATYALFTVLKEERELTSKETFHLFRTAFKTSFVKLSLAAIVWGMMLILISANLLIFTSNYIQLAVIGMLGLILLSLFHFFQYFDVNKPIIYQIKRAFSLAFIMPRNNIGYMAILIILLLAASFSPGITFFFGISVSVFFAVKIGKSQQSKKKMALIMEGRG